MTLAALAMAGPTYSADNGATPRLGEYCPPGSTFDLVNCFFGKAPAGTNAFINQGGFYHSPLSSGSGQGPCPPNTTFDTVNCKLRLVPAGYQPFIYQNGWYVKPNARFSHTPPSCPPGYPFDGAGCLKAYPPPGRSAAISSGPTRFFIFNRNSGEVCGNTLAGSTAFSATACSLGPVPTTWTPFVAHNAWYVNPKIASGLWHVTTNAGDDALTAPLVCRTDSHARQWQLVWSDEFTAASDNQPCYTTDDQIQCVEKPYWGWTRCAGQPQGYSDAARLSWSAAQAATFGGLRDLNKCTWQVFDSFNMWDLDNSAGQNSFRPENIRIENGLLKMKTRFHPRGPGSYDCGAAIDATVNDYTKVCPFSGATIHSPSGKPWTIGNNPSNPNPDGRYTGRQVGYGRIEFRAKIESIGHGAWPALWLFVDEKLDPCLGSGELDALEFLAFDQGDPGQISSQSVTFGNAFQTAHNWGTAYYPHTSQGVSIPISAGEFHIYAVEYEPTEIRFYIDDCLRNRIVDGQIITWWDSAVNNFVSRPFYVPKQQLYTIIISDPASGAGWLPAWYRAETDATGTKGSGQGNFRPTELHLDYVRYYTETGMSGQFEGSEEQARTQHGPRSLAPPARLPPQRFGAPRGKAPSSCSN